MNNVLRKAIVFTIVFSLVWITSCKKEEEETIDPNATSASSESLADAYYEDTDDMALYAAGSANSPAKGRAEAETDARFCTDITFSEGSSATAGVITLDFGTECTDPKGNVRKGKIFLTYSNGPITSENFTIVTTFEAYSINGITLEGTRTVVRGVAATEGNIKHNIVLVNGKATWPDETFATRSANFDREWNPTAQTITLTGEAQGTGRNGNNYVMTITKPLVYKAACAATGVYIASEGTKLFTINLIPLVIDFGTGTCDKVVTVTLGNTSKEVTIGNN